MQQIINNFQSNDAGLPQESDKSSQRIGGLTESIEMKIGKAAVNM